MLSDDLCRLVAMQPLGTGGPRHDATLGIEDDDGVIVEVIDQQSE